MNSIKRLQVASLVSLVMVGAIALAACNDDPITPTPDSGTADATPGTDAGPGDDASDPCGFGEPNDTRETATTIHVNQTYNGCVSNTDNSDPSDFYTFTAPATDNAGGYVVFSMEGVDASGLAEMIVTSDADNGVIFDSYTDQMGASVYGWTTVAPGAKYNIQVTRFAGAGPRFAYTVKAAYTKINDSFEPNNTKETAGPMMVNTPITASASTTSAHTTPLEGEDLDFFKVTLQGGDVTLSMTNVPTDFLCDVALLDASGSSLDEVYSATEGADCTKTIMDVQAGDYFVKVSPFSANRHASSNQDVVDSVKGQYSLVVSQ